MLALLVILIEPACNLASSGTLEQVTAIGAAFLWVSSVLACVPASIIGKSVAMMDWRTTPLAQALGSKPEDKDRSWIGPPADFDGRPDF